MKNKPVSSIDQNQNKKTISNSSTVIAKTEKPPLLAKEKQQKQQPDIKKQRLNSNSSLHLDNNIKQGSNENSSNHLNTSQSISKLQNSDLATTKIQNKRADNSIDGSRSHRSIMSTTSQLSMLKKSSAQVYGAEAGQKPVTKNPWAPIKSDDQKGKQSSNIKSNKSNISLRSESPQNAKKIVKGVQNISSVSSNSIQQKPQTNLKESSSQLIQLQGRKLGSQGINFGSFDSISSKYIENQYKEIKPKQGEEDEMYTLKRISNLSSQLQINQKKKIQKEMQILNLQYEVFLGTDSLNDKIGITTRLNEYLQNSNQLNQQFDNLMEERYESGNYVRINFEGRQIFLDIIKSQTSHSKQYEDQSTQEKQNQGQKDVNQLQQKRKELCLWNTPQNIFSTDNQIDQIEKATNLIEFLENQVEDLNKDYECLLENQKYL